MNRATYDVVDPPANIGYPPQFGQTLDHIVQQLDIITKTVSILETRLTMTESKLQELLEPEQVKPRKA